ncbi:SDR family oxidoreductase [Chloroflexota bacterium]
MLQRLAGKVALVTGAGSGIGRASALCFAREGARVVLADVVDTGGKETLELIRQRGGEGVFVSTDVSKIGDVRNLIEKAVETYGDLHYAHNNAGIGGISASTANCTEENWDKTININLKGVWLCMKYEIIHMLSKGQGAIVNTSASGGLVGLPNLPAYSASKHGVVGLTKSAALECAAAGIRINAVCPGPARTPMIERAISGAPHVEAQIIARVPMGRLASPEEIAETVIWLCSDAASYVTGHTLVIDGGMLAQ